MTAMIETRGLTKRFGKKLALDALTLTVAEGAVCGLLGPNGAGKSTAARILATLLAQDSGSAQVAGFDTRRQPDQVRASIGFVGQYAAVDELLTARQNLTMFARLSHLTERGARRRASELLERFRLGEAADRPVDDFSGGMRRRLDLATGLILRPRVLFLDEPTTGIDPRSRNELWSDVRALARAGTTVLLTTQYLDEADHLATQIAVIDHGAIIANGTPAEIKQFAGGDRLEIVVRTEAEITAAARILRQASDSEVSVDRELRQVSATPPNRLFAMSAVLNGLAEAGVTPDDVTLRRPTLDEAFLALTDPQEA